MVKILQKKYQCIDVSKYISPNGQYRKNSQRTWLYNYNTGYIRYTWNVLQEGGLGGYKKGKASKALRDTTRVCIVAGIIGKGLCRNLGGDKPARRRTKPLRISVCHVDK